MSVVFSDMWGTEEDPIVGDQLADHFDSEEGKRQLERWIVTEYMGIPEENADITFPENGLYAYVKAEILRLRSK